MSAGEYNQLLRARPFTPLRFKFSDGRHVDVRHPEQAIVTTSHIYVAIYSTDQFERMGETETTDAVADDWILVNLMHIVSVEPIKGSTAPGSSARAAEDED